MEAILVVLVAFAAHASESDQMRLLDVVVNGHPRGKIAEFWLRDGVPLITGEQLHGLGIRGSAGLVLRPSSDDSPRPNELISLANLSGVAWRIDEQTQTIYITATDESLLPDLLNDEVGGRPTRHRIDSDSGTGMTLNYDVTGTSIGSKAGSSSSLDARLFSPRGIVSSTLLAYAGSGVGSSIAAPGLAANRVVRLDTAYTFADVNTLRRYSVGDFISGGLAWTRPVRLTGVQIRSDFSMRPDLITFPLPTVSGSTAVPSTVQVLANGNTVLNQSVDAGPFEIAKLPVVNGASSISMTVTNALGQQVTVTEPFYASTSLLAPGLQTFSGQAGLARREWGYLSNDYGKLAGVAEYRRGLSSELTVEGSVEGTPGTVMAGGGAVVRVGSIGVLNAAMAGSGGSGVKGVQGSLGFQRTAAHFSFGASELLSTRGYQDVAALNGDPIPRQQLSASSGVSLKRFGSLGVAYAAIRQDPSLHPLPFYAGIARNASILSTGYSLQLRRTSIYANYFRSFNNNHADGVQVGVTIPFGPRSSVSISEGTDEGYGQVQVQKSAAEIGEWGYDAYVSGEDPAHEFAQLQYKSGRGLFTAGIDQNGSRTSLRGETQGALSFVDGAFFLSNTIFDSFAIVDTNGLPNVGVLQENRDVGSTNGKGLLLVPDLRAFDLNHLGINPTDVPLDTTIDTDTRAIRPQDRSGVIVRFPVKVSHGALLRLVDRIGAPLPVGSIVTLRATRTAFPVGYEGEAYIEDLERNNEVDAELPDGGHCSVQFLYQPVKGVVPTIGPLRCVEESR